MARSDSCRSEKPLQTVDRTRTHKRTLLTVLTKFAAAAGVNLRQGSTTGQGRVPCVESSGRTISYLCSLFCPRSDCLSTLGPRYPRKQRRHACRVPRQGPHTLLCARKTKLVLQALDSESRCRQTHYFNRPIYIH